MIIFNTKEMKSPYSKTEKRIIEINTPFSFNELLNKLIRGEEIEEEKVVINNYEYDNGRLEFYTNEDASEASFSDYETDEDEIELLYNPEYTRPHEFRIFENYQFGQNVAVTYTIRELPQEELLYEMKAAMGTFPTLMSLNLSAEELQKYNNAGKQLIIPLYNLGSTNPAPTIHEIDHFMSLSDYEKRLVTEGALHPYKIFKIIEEIKKDISPNFILNTAITNYMKQSENVRKEATEIVNEFKENKIIQTKIEEGLLEKVKAEFIDQYNFVPRVVDEYIIGRSLRDNITLRNLETQEDKIKEYVKTFNRTSVQQIARSKSISLLAISNTINFAAFPAKARDLISVYVDNKNIGVLEKKGFFTWLSENKDVNPSELYELIKKESLIDSYTKGETAKELLNKAKNKKGYEDSLKYARDNNYKINGKAYNFADNEIAIKGRHIIAKQGDIVMRMLPADDYANFTIGYDTTCCQKYGDAGASCVFKYTTDPFAAAVVVEERGKVKAQGFVWTDEITNTLVFDNIEFAGNDTLDNQLATKYRDIMYEWIKASPYKNVHVGTGYNRAMNGWGKKIDYEAKLPTTIDGEHRTSYGCNNCYSDYHSDAKSLKKDGRMQLTRNTEVPITVEVSPDEPTKWDLLATQGLSFMINDYKKTIEERLDFAKQLKDNPTAELQMKIIKDNPSVIAAIDELDREVQLYILQSHPNYISLIKNPIPEILNKEIYDTPTKILEIENPSEEIIGLALSKEGGLLQYFPNTTSENIEKALRQNGMSIQYLPRERISIEMELAAIENTPMSVTLYPSPSEEAVERAISIQPDLIARIDNPSYRVKMRGIESNPMLILEIKNPMQLNETAEEHNERVKQLWTQAVSRNGYLIRNCGRSFPDLREVALRQNPFVAGILPEITREEIDIAVSLNPAVHMFIRQKEASEYAYEKAKEIYGEENVPVKNVYKPQYQRERQEPVEQTLS